MIRAQFSNYVNQFISYLEIERKFSPHTLRAYKTDLQLFLDFWAHHEEIHNRSFIDLPSLFEQYSHTLHEKYDGKTVARRLSCFSSLSKFLSLHGTELHLTFSRPTVSYKDPSSLTVEEITYLLDTLTPLSLPTQRPLRDKAILELLYSTGMKSYEIVQLRMQDIDHTMRTLLITHPKKPSRSICMGENAYKRIKEYCDQERAEVTLDAEYLFVNYKNQPLTTRSIQRICNMFSSFLERDCTITPVLLRHSCAKHLLDRGASATVIQELLGISALSVEKYCKLS